MRASRVEVYYHFVWATYNRLPLINPEIERAIHRSIQEEALRIRCDVLALNGMPDHIHLFVKAHSTLSPSKIASQVKGVSSHFVRQQLPGNENFNWQEGYGVFSVSRNHRNAVIEYIQNQKEHHAAHTVHADWEETDREA